MSMANRCADVHYSADGEVLFSACRGDRWPAMPPCTYCDTESTRTCDAPGAKFGGRCGVRMCGTHTTRVGEHHDLCREHAQGDPGATLKEGDRSYHVWWEIIETKAVPIPGTARPLEPHDRIPGVRDPDDED
jgi:hypothetical protein